MVKRRVLVGLADGAGYLLTLSNCVKWFPERKGLISAFAIGSYGLGSLGFKFIDTHLLETVGLEKTFVIWGAIVLVMIVFGATLMKDAPKQEVKTSNGVVEKDYTLAESMRKPQYWMLAVMFLTACMSGLYVIGVAKDIAQSLAHLDAISAANAVTVISIANLSGRLVLGILTNRPYPCYHHWSGDCAGGYGGPAVCTIECSDVLCSDCLCGI